MTAASSTPSAPSPRNAACRPARVAVAWLCGQPTVTAPIVGATSARHVDDAVVALDVQLRAEEVAAVTQSYVPHAVSGFT